jgi:uncharacterized protein DUF4411
VLYSIDTCSLIDIWRQFPPDIVVSLWEERLPGLIGDGHLHATREVAIELERQEDELVGWTKNQVGLYVEVDDRVQGSVTNVLGTHPGLIDPNSLRSGADPFVIALAQCEDCTVVTEEKRRGDQVNPKIPDVCEAYNLRCIPMVELIREQGWQFR